MQDSYFFFLSSRFSDFATKYLGKGPNGVIMDDKYSEAPYGDFWTDSGTHLFLKEQPQSWKRPRSQDRLLRKTLFAKVDLIWQLWPIRLKRNTQFMFDHLSFMFPPKPAQNTTVSRCSLYRQFS